MIYNFAILIMVEISRQRWKCYFAYNNIAKWFVLSCCVLVYSLQVRGCTDLFHNTGDDVQMNCSLSGDDVGTPVCRDESSLRLYTNCTSTKTCIRFDNTTNIIMYTVVNITEKDFTNYLCGATTTGSKINFICCFNLLHVSLNSSTESSMTSSINQTSTTMEYVTKEEPSTSYSTIQQSNPDSHRPTHSTDCKTKIELKNIKEYEDICNKRSILYGHFANVTTNCLTRTIQENGGSAITVSVQNIETGRSCNVTCSNGSQLCIVISGEGTDENPSVSSPETDKLPCTIVNNLLYFFGGAMVALIPTIVGLCFFLTSKKKRTKPKQESSEHSQSLRDITLRRDPNTHENDTATSNLSFRLTEQIEVNNELMTSTKPIYDRTIVHFENGDTGTSCANEDREYAHIDDNSINDNYRGRKVKVTPLYLDIIE